MLLFLFKFLKKVAVRKAACRSPLLSSNYITLNSFFGGGGGEKLLEFVLRFFSQKILRQRSELTS